PRPPGGAGADGEGPAVHADRLPHADDPGPGRAGRHEVGGADPDPVVVDVDLEPVVVAADRHPGRPGRGVLAYVAEGLLGRPEGQRLDVEGQAPLDVV